METATRYLHELWSMTAQIAPWMLVGFALAGLMSMFVSRRLVLKVLGRPGMGSIVKATLVGVPMPLCSCGVIPVAAEIREKGATKGATAAFLASTPETGVDSAFATWGMLGPLMALTRIFLAFVTGILAGSFVSLATRGRDDALPPARDDDATPASLGSRAMEALRHAFVKMPGDIAPSLVVGMLLAAVVAAFVPEEGFAFLGHGGLATYVGITLIALPMYVCSTGSIPLAAAMLQAGFSPGGALVFLVSGPATNIATIVAMRKYLGTRAIWAYLAAIVTTAWTAQWETTADSRCRAA